MKSPRSISALAILLLPLISLTACRASLEGKKVSCPPEEIKKVLEADDGLTYYLTQPQFAVEIKDRHENKKAEPVYDLKVNFVPDPTQRYNLRLQTGAVTNDVLKLQLREDGRLISIGSKSEDQTPEIVKALGSLTASALSFGQLGLPIAAGLAVGPDDLPLALQSDACSGQIDEQAYVDLLCIHEQISKATPGCTIAQTLSCTDPVSLATRTIPLPQPAQRLRSLSGGDQDALGDVLTLIGKLIKARERGLWSKLDKDINEAGVPQLEEDVLTSQRQLRALRDFEARVARRLGREPRHQALTPPSPRQFEVERISKNLDQLVAHRVKEARGHVLVDKSIDDLTPQEQASVGQNLSGDRDRFLALAEITNAISTSPLGRQISKLENDIRKRFEAREFHQESKVVAAETESLKDYKVVLMLRDVQTQLAKSLPPGPREQIAQDLKQKREEAERQYARFVRDKAAEADFKKALANYSEAVDRLVAFDERLGATTLQQRRDELSKFLARSIARRPTPTGNESKAFKDFREEYEKVVTEIGTRVGTLTDPKKPEDPLLPGSQTSRTLEEIVSCVITREAQLHEKGGRLLLLADIWTKYGGKDAIVFRMRDDQNGAAQDRIQCGQDLFGGSRPNTPVACPRSEGKQDSAGTRVAQSLQPVPKRQSGMRVRRLRAEDLKDGVELHGVLVQVPVPYTVVTLLQGPAGDRVLQTTTLSLPADDEFLDIGFAGKFLRARELDVKVHASGALDEYTFDTKQKIDKGAQSLAEATDAVTKSLQDIEKAKKEAAPPDPVTAENAELELAILNLMLKANLEAVQEGRPLPYPDLFD